MKNIFFFFILLIPFTSSCQLLDSLSLDTLMSCTSIQQGLLDTANVIKLDLSKNKLSAFPEEIRKFPNLQYLDLSKNKITKIPSWIAELKNLQYLIRSKNKIDTLPPEFGDLAELKYFIMNRSELRSIPHSIGKLKELRYLDLWGDNLSYFPPELKNLSGNLLTFDLRDVVISNEIQAALKEWLPTTTIYFSPSCACEQ